jgi:hypothetical protein
MQWWQLLLLPVSFSLNYSPKHLPLHPQERQWQVLWAKALVSGIRILYGSGGSRGGRNIPFSAG